MTEDEIREAIRAYYQVELDNLADTDTLADLLDGGGDDQMDQANRLLSGARIEIVWAVGSDAR